MLGEHAAIRHHPLWVTPRDGARELNAREDGPTQYLTAMAH
jgi:hypothetical protein